MIDKDGSYFSLSIGLILGGDWEGFIFGALSYLLEEMKKWPFWL